MVHDIFAMQDEHTFLSRRFVGYRVSSILRFEPFLASAAFTCNNNGCKIYLSRRSRHARRMPRLLPHYYMPDISFDYRLIFLFDFFQKLV